MMRWSNRCSLLLAAVFAAFLGGGVGSAAVEVVNPDDGTGPWNVFPEPPAGGTSLSDGRFLLVAGPSASNASLAGTPGGPGRTLIQLWWPESATNGRIAVFDADTDGLWDERTGINAWDILTRPDTDYEVFLDTENDAAARLQAGEALPVLQARHALEPEIAGTDAQWLQLFDLPLSASTLATDGVHRFVLRVTLRTFPDPRPDSNEGREINGFKLAHDGSAEVTANSVIGFVGGAVDEYSAVPDANGNFPDSSFDLLPEPRTDYDGTVEFFFDSRAVCGLQGELFLEEADSDWNETIPPGTSDDAPTGLPPDDGGIYQPPPPATPGLRHDSSGLKISPAIVWEFVDPDGVVRFSSTTSTAAGHASTNAAFLADPFVHTALDKNVFLAHHGRWTLRWRGVDIRNFVFWRMNIPLGDPPPTCAVRGRVVCADTLDPIADALITLRDAAQQTVATARTAADGSYSIPLTATGAFTATVSEALLNGAPLPPVGPTTQMIDFQDACSCPPALADFTFRCCTGRVTAEVFCDDGDGVVDAGDARLPGIAVLVEGDGPDKTIQSDAAGPAGVDVTFGAFLTVSVDPNQPALAGKTLLTPPLAIDGIGCEPMNVQFLLEAGSVTGRVYCDTDGSGDFTPGVDQTFEGVAVPFTPPLGNLPVGIAVTGPDGTFTMPGLTPGPWHFDVDTTSQVLVDANATIPPANEQVVVDVDCEPATIEWRFQCGCLDPGTVRGQVYCDLDGDGAFGAGDRTFADVLIVITTEDGTVLPPNTTGADGSFAVTLSPGTWTLTIDPTTGGLAGSGATLQTPESVEVEVECDGDHPVEWRFHCPCTCPPGCSTDCTGGYHWVEMEIDLFVSVPVAPSWTNPFPSAKAKGKGKGSRKVGLPWQPTLTTVTTGTQHVLTISAGIDALRIPFCGDSWHGHERRGILHVTDVWRVERCHWKVKVKVWACDRPDGTRGCLPGSICIKPRLDGSYQAVCLDLTCANGPLPLGAITDDCGNPWYRVLCWRSCKDAECCPANPCCSGPCCPPQPQPPPCACGR